MARKIAITIIGSILTLLGIILIVLPGPAWLLLPIGLAILSLEYDWAKKWLKKSQAYMTRSAYWLDKKIRQFRYDH